MNANANVAFVVAVLVNDRLSCRSNRDYADLASATAYADRENAKARRARYAGKGFSEFRMFAVMTGAEFDAAWTAR